MNKQTEALKLALEGLEKWHFDKDPRGAADYIAAIHDALAEHIPDAGKMAEQGCDYCNHPQYAGTKCNNCGREQPAQQHIEHCLWARNGNQPCPHVQPANVAAVNTSSERVDKTEENVHEKPAQQQEPVAWRYALDASVEGPRWIYIDKDPHQWLQGSAMVNAAIEELHTSPPASKPWVGLTQEDMYEIGEFKNTHGYVPTGFKRLAAAIEAKLREKNA